MTTIEHKELRGITTKNLMVTVMSTASIVASVMTTYYGLKDDIHEVSIKQETQARVYEIRLKVLESEVALLQQRITGFKTSDASRKQVTFASNKSSKSQLNKNEHTILLFKNLEPN